MLPMATSSRLLDRLLVTLLALTVTTAAAAALHDLHQTSDEIAGLGDIPPHLLAFLEPPPPVVLEPPDVPRPESSRAPSASRADGVVCIFSRARPETPEERQSRLLWEQYDRDLELLQSAGVLDSLR